MLVEYFPLKSGLYIELGKYSIGKKVNICFPFSKVSIGDLCVQVDKEYCDGQCGCFDIEGHYCLISKKLEQTDNMSNEEFMKIVKKEK